MGRECAHMHSMLGPNGRQQWGRGTDFAPTAGRQNWLRADSGLTGQYTRMALRFLSVDILRERRIQLRGPAMLCQMRNILINADSRWRALPMSTPMVTGHCQGKWCW